MDFLFRSDQIYSGKNLWIWEKNCGSMSIFSGNLDAIHATAIESFPPKIIAQVHYLKE